MCRRSTFSRSESIRESHRDVLGARASALIRFPQQLHKATVALFPIRLLLLPQSPQPGIHLVLPFFSLPLREWTCCSRAGFPLKLINTYVLRLYATVPATDHWLSASQRGGTVQVCSRLRQTRRLAVLTRALAACSLSQHRKDNVTVHSHLPASCLHDYSVSLQPALCICHTFLIIVRPQSLYTQGYCRERLSGAQRTRSP